VTQSPSTHVRPGGHSTVSLQTKERKKKKARGKRA
jgi:hypothetical protein